MSDEKILVSEIFLSIDGEAYHAGRPTVFFRTVGCNLRCSWCDSKYTFRPDDTSAEMTVDEAVAQVKSFGVQHVTVTGGEPLLHGNREFMFNFIDTLIRMGYSVDIETNGAVDLKPYKEHWDPTCDVTFIMDWKCPSSGMSTCMVEDNLAILSKHDIVKCVVADEDFDTVEALLGKLLMRRDSGLPAVYISPVFGQVTMSKIPEFVLAHTEYPNLICQLQLHKYFWDPKRRGV